MILRCCSVSQDSWAFLERETEWGKRCKKKLGDLEAGRSVIGRHVHWSDLDDAPIFAAIRERIANVEARIVGGNASNTESRGFSVRRIALESVVFSRSSPESNMERQKCFDGLVSLTSFEAHLGQGLLQGYRLYMRRPDACFSSLQFCL